ncbi:MAG: IclR family transcriptional regulator [Clostridia bacterium]|nr:IclR family transcriptional regulator [Clostridia bacterium]
MAIINEKELESNKNIKVKSLYKALLLLDYFKETNKSALSATELAQLSGLLVTSVHNIMSTFMEYGLIQKNPVNHKYSLGKKFVDFSNIYTTQNPIQKEFSRIMRNLCEESGETVLLAVPYGTDVLYLDSASPKNSFTPSSKMFGVTAPMYCTAIGKAILSISGENVIQQVVQQEKTAFTENTLLDGNDFINEINTTMHRGYAIDNMEHEYGVKCVAVAVKAEGQIYGLSITGPSLRFPVEKIETYALKLLAIKQAISSSHR